MSLLIFSDLHLDEYRRFSTIGAGGLNSRLIQQINVIQQVIKIAKEIEPEAVVFLGDLFNGQGRTIAKTLYLVGHELIQQLQKVAPVYLVVGNHDMYGGSHILAPMAGMSNVIVIENTQRVDLLGLNVFMMPWGGVTPIDGDILLGHLDIEGVKTGIGYELPGTIHPKEVAQFKLVVSGHYHTYQKIEPNILYCGAVMPITFGDTAEEDYGVLTLGSDLRYNRVLIDSPKFIPMIISTQQNMDKFAANKGSNYYRLTVTDRKITIPKFDHTVEIDWDIQEEMKARLEYDVDAPLEDILCTYIDKANTKIDKEQAKLVLREVMKEC
jgi:DNA repair exonuclease SbcCD nuclease subunit